MEEAKASRARLRGKVTKLTNDLREYRLRSDLDQDDLAYKVHILGNTVKDLQSVQVSLDKEGVLDETNHVELALEEVFKGERVLCRLESKHTGPSPAAAAGPDEFDLRSSLVVRLPTFEGDVLQWPEFWELFRVAIHLNQRYAPVQRFVLLKSHLGSVPKRVIEGIPLSDVGYQLAVDALTCRFDREGVRRELLMKQLLDLPCCKTADVPAMHRFLDHLTARVRGLEALGVTDSSFSSILLPVLREKLPESWRLEWARHQTTDFQEFLSFLQNEMRVREQAAAAPVQSTVPPRPPAGWGAVSALAANRQPGPARSPGRYAPRSAACARDDWVCVACGDGRHGLAACQMYRGMTVDGRWEAVKAASVCYRCLGPHLVRDCRSSNCPMCGGPHHSSLHRTSANEPPRRPPQSGRNESRPPPGFYGPPPVRNSSRPPPGFHGPPQLLPAEHPNRFNQPVYPAPLPPAAAGQHSQSQGRYAPVYRQGMSAQITPDAQNPPVEPDATACAPYTASVMTAASAPLPAESTEGSPCDPLGTPPDPANASDAACYTQTALAVATGPQGTCRLRVLLDGGSDSSYIRTSAADALGLATVGSGVFACMGFQERGEEPRTYEKVRLTLRSRHGGEDHVFELWKTDRLCSQPTPARPPTVVFEPHVLFADDFQGGSVDVLIGVDQIYKVVLHDQICLSDRLRAVDTVFGYVIHGREELPVTSPSVRYALRCSRRLPEEEVKQLWCLEAIGISEDEARPHAYPTWSLEDQRYEMGLLWTSDERPVTNLYSAAIRTKRMEARLTCPEREEYARHLAELQKNCVIEESPAGDVDGFYLPHRGVWRKEKLRVVFDGSARDPTGRSLNDLLETGGNLLRRVPAVLLNFRRGAVAAQTDIRSAFHMVSIAERDRRYLQFLWSDQRLRFRRVPFGLSCSPYLLLQTLSSHICRYRSTDPSLCRMLEKGLYMDDICLSFTSRTEAERAMERTVQIFGDARMELHKLRITGDDSEDSSVLGLRWSTKTDCLAVCLPTLSAVRTKRGLLSTLGKLFDPLGVLSPWLVVGRAVFQRTWKEQPSAGWDDDLSPDALKELSTWCRDASDRDVWFPRSLSITDDVTYHVFCDASKRAYCCVIYAVTDGDSRLVMAKSRLAPVTPALSVPRLELMAALIGCRLMEFVRSSLGLDAPRVVYWTDAKDVLYWISSKKALKLFVHNRVRTITEMSSPEQWRHVRGEDNPADVGTRGMSLAALEKCDVWWKGPAFLRDSSHPEPPLSAATGERQPSPEAAVESKKERPTVRESLGTRRSEPMPFDLTECSSLTQAVNRLTWMRRFVSNSRVQKETRVTGPLSPEERRSSLLFLIRVSQLQVYPEELKTVRSGELLPRGSPLTKLRPQLSEEGVLLATLRTGERPVPILPEQARITTLIVEEAHRRCFHQGTRVTLALLTAEYAVRRRTVRRAVDSCRRCRRYRCLPYRSPEGVLPSFRVQPSRPFAKVGIDYFGPLYVGGSAEKVWVLLITCATSRAVHLELVHSQSTADLVLGLRRFFALRGTPALIYSDNARTFRALLGQLPRAWRHRRRVSDQLTRRWNCEYQRALRCWHRSPRGQPNRTPEVGDVVLVHNEGPRGRWPLARVTELLVGPDGQTRAAFIQLRGRRTRRPLSRLFPLEAAP